MAKRLLKRQSTWVGPPTFYPYTQHGSDVKHTYNAFIHTCYRGRFVFEQSEYGDGYWHFVADEEGRIAKIDLKFSNPYLWQTMAAARMAGYGT